MTDINTELERIADETLGNPLEEASKDNLDTKGDPRAPTKGAAKAQAEEKIDAKGHGKIEDMGPAVVSPDAKSDPGDAATDKAKKLLLLADRVVKV